jgi:hypothetical protein
MGARVAYAVRAIRTAQIRVMRQGQPVLLELDEAGGAGVPGFGYRLAVPISHACSKNRTAS